MTTVHVVILGLLCDQSLHGYEIKHIIEEHMDDWTDIKFGSIYFALSRLEEKGFVEVMEEVQEGNRPARTVYRITEKGRGEFTRLLGQLWGNNAGPFYSFDIALFFIGRMPKEQARGLLAGRIVYAQKALEHLDVHRRMLNESIGMPKQAGAIVSHTVAHVEAELHWLEELKNHLEEYF